MGRPTEQHQSRGGDRAGLRPIVFRASAPHGPPERAAAHASRPSPHRLRCGDGVRRRCPMPAARTPCAVRPSARRGPGRAARHRGRGRRAPRRYRRTGSAGPLAPDAPRRPCRRKWGFAGESAHAKSVAGPRLQLRSRFISARPQPQSSTPSAPAAPREHGSPGGRPAPVDSKATVRLKRPERPSVKEAGATRLP